MVSLRLKTFHCLYQQNMLMVGKNGLDFQWTDLGWFAMSILIWLHGDVGPSLISVFLMNSFFNSSRIKV